MLICTTEELAAFCAPLRGAPYVAIDTEFMSDRTYFPQLCLIQIAHGTRSAAIDALAAGLNLAPLAELLAASDVLKVMHAGRQDLQILERATGVVAAPYFDTQIAASVCGHGDQPGYDRLVRELLGRDVDKASQATDWSRRPLTERQVKYALGDVTHLCDVYEALAAELERSGRGSWIEEEMLGLLELATQAVEPEQAYRRIKLRRGSPRSLAILRELAAWRERAAIERDLPRGWVVRDDALAELAQNPARDRQQLARVRGLKDAVARGADGKALLAAIERGRALADEDCPQPPERPPERDYDESMVALLQALLRLRCDAHGVAPRLVATRTELEAIAAEGDVDVAALRGFRREIFGEDALALREGRLTLTGEDGRVVSRSR
ncbi:MAG: ribonuclease D [Myxococcales bacterium]|nr:ribonuclease D [Myxococcales bacterium]